MQPLSGFTVVSLAINVPGPVAAAALRAQGATVHKIEPPAGDPLAQFSTSWYDELCEGVQVTTLNLKSSDGMKALMDLLAGADLLLTATRPAALQRLGLDWPTLHAQFPTLCQVGITGFPHPHQDHAGHDLTYQAACGTLHPPHMPNVLLADMAGAQEAVSAALGLLLARERGQEAGQAWVALSDAAEKFSVTLRKKVTTPGGILGNGLATYNIYATRDGHIALAALEAQFHKRLLDALGVSSVTREALTVFFMTRNSGEWLAWAEQHGIPLGEVL